MSINKKRIQQLLEFQKKISICFDSQEILNQAFIHPSFTSEKEASNEESNQRLEFLGDAVLELVVSEYLYKNYPYLTEGQMTKVRAFTVCEPSLAEVSKRLLLGDYLILGKGEENTRGREKTSILADTFEALLGSIYIDKNYDTVRDFTIRNLESIILKAVEGEWGTDYKTNLQEILQRTDSDKISYNVIKESGPDHDKVFYVEVVWKNEVLGTGFGKSKKQAEQQAAKEAITKIKDSRKI